MVRRAGAADRIKAVRTAAYGAKPSLQKRGSHEPTPPNVRYAVRLRGEILNAIERGTFNYADYFPESPRARQFGFVADGKFSGRHRIVVPKR